MRAVSLAALSLAILAVPVACSSSDDATRGAADAGTDSAGNIDVAPPPTADAGEDGGFKPPPPAGCVEEADANSPEAVPCIADSFAVFADASAGSDDADGSQAHPKKTITGALVVARATKKQRVYVCGAGPYPEHITFDTGIRIIGGVACTSWKFDGTRARVAPTDPGPVLRMKGATDPIVLSDLEVQPFDITDKKDGSSSIGIFATKSNLKLTRVTVIALDGAAGAAGVQGANPGFKTTSTNAAGEGVGVTNAICTCATGEITQGGSGENSGAQPGLPGKPIYTSTMGEHGLPGSGLSAGKHGDPGPKGASAFTSTTLGVLSETDWLPKAGADAVAFGDVGQGGGGGGCGSDFNTCFNTTHAVGAGGGCGGCGGAPGKGGGGGGASLALVLIETSLTANDCTFQSGAGGTGGASGEGGTGSEGGKGGDVNGLPSGGKGGFGGNGGAGAGGAGGLSAGILYKGSAPLLDAQTVGHFVIGKPGFGGKTSVFSMTAGPPGKADKLLDYDKL